MTWLTIVLEDRSVERTLISAIVNIYDITSGRVDRQNKPNLFLDHNRLSIDLRPGKYVAELRLPAGNLIRKEVEVKDQPSQDEFLDLRSPHEWLWLHAAVGNVGGRSDYEDRLAKAVPMNLFPRVALLPKTWIVSSKTLSVGDYAINSTHIADRLRIAPSEIREGYFMLYPELRRAPLCDRDRELGSQPIQIAPTVADGIAQVFELSQRQVMDLTFQGGRIDAYYRGDDFVRWYFWTQFPGFPPQYSVLPIPWQSIESGEPESVQIYVNVEPVDKVSPKNYDALHRIAVAVNDQYFSSLIGYLGSGDMPSASVIFRRAKEILFYKVENPLSAAAGAYVLLAQTEPEEQHYAWHDWIRNLMNWYKWLPDGAIQWAWLQMVEKNMNASEADIKNSLLEAYNRGLPYYSAGVKLLMNGLTIFAQRLKTRNRSDLEIEKALNRVQLLASRIDRRQPFTSVIAD